MSKRQNIGSLTDFQRNATAHLKRLKRSGRPQVLTVNGQPELVVQDAASYQKLLDDLEKAQAVAGIRRGLESMKRGAGRPMRQALEDLGRRHGIQLGN
jgi:prevent-host-death family protein